MEHDYGIYLAEDFLQDEWFRLWIVENNPEAREFWEEWIVLYPEKKMEVLRARVLLEALGENQHPKPEEVNSAIEETVEKIRNREKVVKVAWYRWLYYAAAVILVAGFFQLSKKIVKNETVEKAIGANRAEWRKKVNDGSTPLKVLLEDGTKVVLQPHAELTYKSTFERKERRTYLVGNAFFEVAHDSERPFYVVTEKLVTRVLGTSFWIRTSGRNDKTSVIVRTGRVSVCPRNSNGAVKDKVEEVILTPNQKADFSWKTAELNKVLIENPEKIGQSATTSVFYDDAPISKVFTDLETSYGVKIVYDNELLKKCQLNATLGNEPFYTKLDLICQSIRATYRQENAVIVIESKGCSY